MLHLKILQIHAIGRFVDPQTINFDRMGNLVQVDGLNKNTGGSSGAAKSTIFNAIDYLLGLNDIPVTVLQSRLTKDPIHVKGIFDWDGKELAITRGKSVGLQIKVDGESKGGNVKLSEEELDKILAMPRELFQKILHKRQKEGGFFLKMAPKENYEFLMDCLHLDKEKKDVETIEKRLSELKPAIESTTALLEVQKQGLKATQDAILSVGLAPIKDMHEEVVNALKEKAALSLANVNVCEKSHNVSLSALLSSKPKYISIPFVPSTYTTSGFDKAMLSRCEEAFKGLGEQIQVIQQKEWDRKTGINREISILDSRKILLGNQAAEGQKAQKEAEEKASQIHKLRDNKCFTCKQDWMSEDNKLHERILLNDLLKLKQVIDEGASADIELMDFDSKMQGLLDQLADQPQSELEEVAKKKKRVEDMIFSEKEKEKIHNKAESDKLRAHQESEKLRLKTHQEKEHADNTANQVSYTAKENELREKQKLEYQQAFGQYDIDNRTYETAAQKLALYNASKKHYDESIGRLKSQETEYMKNVDGLGDALSKFKEELVLAEETKRALKSYISRCFDEALESISDVASRMLAHVPNMATSTIQMRGSKETKEGKVKEEVNAVINMDGEEAIPIRSLSGGERSATDLAIDLAVIDFLEHRTGKGINIFILDEPFEGLDGVCIENVLEILKNVNLNKKIIIVDHNPITKSSLPQTVMVIREGEKSRVEV